MLRLIIIRAKAHFNSAVEHAEKSRYLEALSELDSALELNAKFAEAHVLRGTILARMERLAEAEESWKNALQLNPQALRAHRYLAQSVDVKAASPLMKRLRMLLAGAAGVTALALLIAIGASLSGPSRHDLDAVQGAWKALHEDNLAESYRLATSLSEGRPRTELLSAADRQVRSRLDAATILANQEKYPEALALLEEVRAMHLPQDAAADLTRVRADLRTRLNHSILEGLRRVSGRDEDRRLVKQRLDDFASHFPEAKLELAELKAEHLRELNDEVDRRLAAIDRALTTGDDSRKVTELLADVEELALETDRKAQLDDKLRALARREAASLFASATAAINDNNIPAYEQALAALKSMSHQQQDYIDRAVGLRTLLLEREHRQMIDQLRAALDERSWRKALGLADALQKLDLKFDDALVEELDNARTALAIESYYSVMDMADAIDNRSLTEQQARTILERIDETRDRLPQRLRIRAEENLLYFSIVALRKLGDQEEATRRTEKLRTDYPGSTYLAGI